ncbi:MAG: diguanylate cyclase [Hyphomicrobiales bacterium]|nr:diguanylate cyclase [Hyphomicrobiales bacterium]
MSDSEAANGGTPSPPQRPIDVVQPLGGGTFGSFPRPALAVWLIGVVGLLAVLVGADSAGPPTALVGLIAAALLVMAGLVVVLIERMVNQHETSRQALLAEKQRLHIAVANMPHGVCMYDADKRLAVANDQYSTMYGLRPEHAKPGTTLDEILRARVAAGCSPKNAEHYISKRLQEAFLPAPGYIVNELQDGRIIAISRRPLPDGGSVAIHQDITEQKRAEQKVLHLAHYDALTELANRVLFLQEIGKSINKFRISGERFAVHLLDLDRFKDVNDSLGHAVGDFLLFEVASRVGGCAGPQDVVARLGGDEFAVLQRLSDPTPEQVTALATELLKAIAQPFYIGSHQLMIETSLGVSIAPEHSLNADELLKKPISRFIGQNPTAATRGVCSKTLWSARPMRGWRWPWICAMPSSSKNSRCITSRSLPVPARAWPASKRWFAGVIRSAVWLGRKTLFRSPKKPARLSRLASGSCGRPAAMPRPGRCISRSPSISRRYSFAPVTWLNASKQH